MKGLPVEMTSYFDEKVTTGVICHIDKKACGLCGLYGRIAVAIINTLWGPTTAFFNLGLI
jgi:hypothetical protein